MLPTLSQLPAIGPWLPLALILHGVAQWRLPRLWLLTLPLASTGLDLTAWTGRLLFNEFDGLVLAAVAVGLFFGRCCAPDLRAPARWIWVLLLLSLMLLQLPDWQVFLRPPGAASENPYYASGYAYRLAKGVLWAALLVPQWWYLYREDALATRRWLLSGVIAAALALLLWVLWERGSLAVILSLEPWWAWVQSLLDLATSYRVTGPYTDTHTGGEAIDGLLVLLFPLALYGVAAAYDLRLRLLSLLAAAALCYVALVGFTRATYLALGVEALLVVLLAMRHHGVGSGYRALAKPLLLLAPLLLLWSASRVFAAAGSVGLFGAVCLGSLCALLPAAGFPGNAGTRRLLLVVAAAAALALVLRAHLNSRFVEDSPGSMAQLTAWVALHALAFHRVSRLFAIDGMGGRVLLVGACALAAAAAAFALNGTQIGQRAAVDKVRADLQTRSEHWSRVLASGGDSLQARLLGNGPGSYPAAYIGRFPERVRDVGSFAFRSGGGVKLGAGDLRLVQRVRIAPERVYPLVVEVSAAQPNALRVALCERNVLHSLATRGSCRARRVAVPATGAGERHVARLQLESAAIGRGGQLGRWPTTFEMSVLQQRGAVTVHSLVLLDNGRQRLDNADFASGMDRWLFYSDIRHLPWHIKNTWLHVYFEAGVLGLLAVLALLAAAWGRDWSGDSPLLPVCIAAAVSGLLVLGVFGTPLDAPRVSWLFYFFLFLPALAPPAADAAGAGRAGAQSGRIPATAASPR